MKRIIALALAIVLLLSLFVVCVSAQSVSEGTSSDETVLTVGAIEQTVDAAAGQQNSGEMDLGEVEITQYAEEEEMEDVVIKQYAEEETGFWAWLKRLWKSILAFFGL